MTTSIIVAGILSVGSFLLGVFFEKVEHNETMKAALSENDALRATVLKLQTRIGTMLDEKDGGRK